MLNLLRPSEAYMRRLTNWTSPSHYLNQCWNIINWTLETKFKWNLNRNLCIFIHDNALENVVCEMASILSRPQCANGQISLSCFRGVLSGIRNRPPRPSQWPLPVHPVRERHWLYQPLWPWDHLWPHLQSLRHWPYLWTPLSRPSKIFDVE